MKSDDERSRHSSFGEEKTPTRVMKTPAGNSALICGQVILDIRIL